MECLIITGGNISHEFAGGIIQKGHYGWLIAADSGIDFCYEAGILPDLILGDFDSADPEKLTYFRQQEHMEICELKPEKDETDTESAIREAIRRGASCITVLGAFGTRLDHVLANVSLLGIGLEAGVRIELLDPNNRVRMFDHSVILRRAEQYGRFVSVIPYSDVVTGVTLSGVKYPLTDHKMEGFHSLGVSNEIIEEEAGFSFEKGIILLVESRD